MPQPARDNQKLSQIAANIRQSIIKMLLEAGSGHSAGALGMTDVFTALYFQIINHNPQEPYWSGRDRVILSNGHICPVWYSTLAEAGYFPKEELMTFRKLGSRLQGHPSMGSAPGVENTSGPLGQGLSQAIGIALSYRLDKQPNRVYCLMSDGDFQEGQNWEALLFAANQKLNNLTVLIDRNFIQIGGNTEEILPLEPFKLKLDAFNWNTIEIDGHNFEEIINACQIAQDTADKPTAIICNITPGKGVDFMENDFRWHGKPPNQEEAEIALRQINLSISRPEHTAEE